MPTDTTRSATLDLDALTVTVGERTHSAEDLGLLEDRVLDLHEDGDLTLAQKERFCERLDEARRAELERLVDQLGLSQSEISRRLGKAENYIRRKTSGGAAVFMADIYALRGLANKPSAP